MMCIGMGGDKPGVLAGARKAVWLSNDNGDLRDGMANQS